MSAPRVLRLPANAAGRDFVVGDIHGAFSLLDRALTEASFNTETDRLFIVGDLIDRGRESHRVAEFLKRPYVYAVQGNHEAMLLDLYADGEPDEMAVVRASRYNGLGWWPTVHLAQRRVILDALRTLPIVIEVDGPAGPIGVVHADIPVGMTWQEFVRRIETSDREVTQTALWGRDRLDNGFIGGVPGVDRVFVGHTPQRGGAVVLGNVAGIDTGAVFGDLGKWPDGHLTLVETTVALDQLAARRTDNEQVRVVARAPAPQAGRKSRWKMFS